MSAQRPELKCFLLKKHSEAIYCRRQVTDSIYKQCHAVIAFTFECIY